MRYIRLNDEEVQLLYQPEKNLDNRWELGEKEYVIFQDEFSDSILGTYRNEGDVVYPVPRTSIQRKGGSFEPLNHEQKCYFHLLADWGTPIKVCAGIAGAGKTKAALEFGFSAVADQHSPIQRMLLIREPVGMGKDLGYLTGNKNNKASEWNNHVKDNIKYDKQLTFSEMLEKGIIEIDVPHYMQGRSIENTWVIIDEAQNLTREQFIMLGTRISRNSQIIFTGDLAQLAQDRLGGGLSRAMELAGKTPLMSVVKLTEDVRSDVSKFFATCF